MAKRLRRLQHLLERVPWAGHPAIETMIERTARHNAYRAGYALAVLVRSLAPGVALEPLAQAFDEGLEAAEQAPTGSATVFRFPGQ